MLKISVVSEKVDIICVRQFPLALKRYVSHCMIESLIKTNIFINNSNVYATFSAN